MKRNAAQRIRPAEPRCHTSPSCGEATLRPLGHLPLQLSDVGSLGSVVVFVLAIRLVVVTVVVVIILVNVILVIVRVVIAVFALILVVEIAALVLLQDGPQRHDLRAFDNDRRTSSRSDDIVYIEPTHIDNDAAIISIFGKKNDDCAFLDRATRVGRSPDLPRTEDELATDVAFDTDPVDTECGGIFDVDSNAGKPRLLDEGLALAAHYAERQSRWPKPFD